MRKLQEISQYVNRLQSDLTAEALIAALSGHNLHMQEVIVALESTLKRRWSHDIAYCDVEQFEDNTESLTFHLNRDGIYDVLPEALFHNFTDSDSMYGDEMAKESMKLRSEEKDTRSFFRPFENAIFSQRIHLSTTESQLFESIYTELLQGIIPDFWRIDDGIPKKYAERIIKLLPFAHKIIGNYDLTAQCLSFILNEKVNLVVGGEPEPSNDLETPVLGIIGESSLGNDTICGSRVSGFINRITVQVGPVEQTPVKDFLMNGVAQKTIYNFYNYFIPMELDINTQLIFSDEDNKFVLEEAVETNHAFLGYNTVLG